MTNSDELAFMTAILASPDDDTPRLVFADWLDERAQGDDAARAALIRAQCRLEYLEPGSKERRKLEREANAILRKHEKRWTKALNTGGFLLFTTFRRGFLNGINIKATRFVASGDDLFRIAPTICAVRFPYAANEVSELADSPLLAKLASVDLNRMCTCGYCSIDLELRDLFRSKHAANLQRLSVSRDRIDAEVARALTRSTVLENLKSLDLSENPLEIEGGRTLAKSRHLRKLTTLNLAHTQLHVEGAEWLASAKHFNALTRLNLSANRIGPRGVEALVAAPFFNQLTELDLSNNRIGEVGAWALASASDESKLERLVLRGTTLGVRPTKLLQKRFGKKVIL